MLRKLRWAEPIGQLAVLISIGIQLFWVGSVNSITAEIDRRKQVSLIEHVIFDLSYLLEKNDVKLSNKDISIRDVANAPHFDGVSEDKLNAILIEKSLFYNKLYAAIFIFGSLFVIVGKSASIASSK